MAARRAASCEVGRGDHALCAMSFGSRIVGGGREGEGEAGAILRHAARSRGGAPDLLWRGATGYFAGGGANGA
jgi:hypothetical protein